MRRIIFLALIIQTGFAQPKNEHYTQVDTAWLFSDDEMTHEDSLKQFFMLDTMPGMTNYGPHGKKVLELTKSVFGTEVGGGGCTELCWMMQGKLGIREKEKIVLKDTSSLNQLVVGDIIHITPYMYLTLTGDHRDKIMPERINYHDMLYVGRASDTEILVAEQNWCDGFSPVRVIRIDTQKFIGRDNKPRYFTATLVR